MIKSFPVSAAKRRELAQLMDRYGVSESDLVEDFIRGSGAGGQKINKTSSCVQLSHRPTGLVIRCQATRSLARNRFLARRLLVNRVAADIAGKESAEQQRIAKLRRQKRRRSRRAQEKILMNKKNQALKKRHRQRPGMND